MCVLCVPCQAEHAKIILSVLRILILTYICTNEKCLRVYLHFSVFVPHAAAHHAWSHLLGTGRPLRPYDIRCAGLARRGKQLTNTTSFERSARAGTFTAKRGRRVVYRQFLWLVPHSTTNLPALRAV